MNASTGCGTGELGGQFGELPECDVDRLARRFGGERAEIPALDARLRRVDRRMVVARARRSPRSPRGVWPQDRMPVFDPSRDSVPSSATPARERCPRQCGDAGLRHTACACYFGREAQPEMQARSSQFI